MNIIAAHDKAGYPTYLEAAMNMPIEQILPLWQTYLNDVVTYRTKNLSFPISQIFDNKTAFEDFVRVNNFSVTQPVQSD